ncbi:MAG TPA: type IX secretion system outer membrane channel protein PorV [Salinivirgaceae bacterium]|nr:type IX secretion system outer membrane channel protein PorV [Salinivirgaceae bacterium]
MNQKPIVVLLSSILVSTISAQNPNDPDILGRKFNPIKHALPFLTISPDSRSAGMGDVGVATSPDAYSINWNIGKLANIDGKTGIGLGYTPWLRKLNVKDINLTYLSGYYRIDENQVLASSLRYFSLGSMIFTDNQGNPIKDFNPNEFSFDAGYSRRLGPKFSMGLASRFIYSNLTGTMQLGSETLKPAKAFSIDLGAFYQNQTRLGDYPSKITAGIAFTNIGTKVTYSENNKNFLPMNLRLGGGLNLELDQYNGLGFYVDLNKLLVPTPDPRDTLNSNQNISVASAIFQSFSDAPGYHSSKYREELQEIMWSVGIEYLYDKKLAIRTGYFYENEFKGNRKYFTAGAGFKLNVLSMDISYLIPTVANHPLAQTLRFSLVLDLGAMMD